MKNLMPLFLVLLAGCHNDLPEERVEKDFREIVGARYPEIRVVNVERVAFGDGWDDGVELKVLFKGACGKGVTPTDSNEGACSIEEKSMQMEISYQRDQAGDWQVLANSIKVR